MDTGLKKYKLIRRLAALFAAILLFVSGLFTCFFLKGIFFYNRYRTAGEYTDSSVFRSVLNTVENFVIENGEYLSCENDKDIANTSVARANKIELENLKQEVQKACDFLDSCNLKPARIKGATGNWKFKFTDSNNDTYYLNPQGYWVNSESVYDEAYYNEVEAETETTTFEAISDDELRESETAYEAAQEESEQALDSEQEASEREFEDVSTEPVTAYADPDLYNKYNYGDIDSVANALEFIHNRCSGYNYGDKTTEELVNLAELPGISVEAQYQIWGAQEVEDYASSIKFAVFYKTTGKVYTNCGVTLKDDEAAIEKKLGGTFTESTVDGKHSVKGETPYKISSEFYSQADDYYTVIDNYDDLISKAYFSFDIKSAERDAVKVGSNAYNAYYRQSSINHVRGENNNLTFYAVIAIISFLLGMVCCLLTIVYAGKTNEGGVKIRFADKVPFAINAALSCGLVIGFGALIFGMNYYEHNPLKLFIYNSFPLSLAIELAKYVNFITALLFMLSFLIITGLIASIVRNIRNKTFIKHTLCHYLLAPVKYVFRKLRKLMHNAAEKAKEIYATDYAYGNGKKFLIISAVVIAAVIVFNFILLFAGGFSRSALALFIGILLNLAIGAVLILFVICFDRIASGVTQIKLGSLTCNINTRFMPGFMRSTAEDISKIREGLQAAVNQAVRDQAMKTELITNVTHDLKTPLTSIITYVDLLKTEGFESENAGEYLNVIDEKSQKLKKLVDDLVQASKASSGAMDVNLTRLDMCEFANQIAGEYQEELKNAGIDLVIQVPQSPVFVKADPQLLGRVFENLISNIKKYALANTRAFLTVEDTEIYGTITFKNTSSSPLDSDSEKLTERFYRGDSARTGEGSGLGLSIAKDLCVLQGGAFDVITDGDLFKAIITLPAANE